MGTIEVLVGLVAVVVGIVDTFEHPATGGADNHQLVLLVIGFVGLVIGAETLRSRYKREVHRPSWPGPGAAIIAAMVGLVFGWIVMGVALYRYVPNPSGSSAYEYCPPVFQQPDYTDMPPGSEGPCESARGLRARLLVGALILGGALPVGVVLAFRSHGRSTDLRQRAGPTLT